MLRKTAAVDQHGWTSMPRPFQLALDMAPSARRRLAAVSRIAENGAGIDGLVRRDSGKTPARPSEETTTTTAETPRQQQRDHPPQTQKN